MRHNAVGIAAFSEGELVPDAAAAGIDLWDKGKIDDLVLQHLDLQIAAGLRSWRNRAASAA
ncbi:hypothetical protein SDC9_76569 [bioreactor metagenome]|uniref:Uncharacterized protein n=1 Tax=bioreactor metagenome TaxID=1076179 RepID=A0A644YP22_9ZZZZ